MAKASVNTVVVKTITLELTEEEAQVLRCICNKIGGSEYKSPRKITEKIKDALEKVQVPHIIYPIHEGRPGCIWFKDYTDE